MVAVGSVASGFASQFGAIIMDRIERLLLRVAIGVVVVLLIREFMQPPAPRPASTGSGTMAMNETGANAERSSTASPQREV